MLARDVVKVIEHEDPRSPERKKVWLKVAVMADLICEELGECAWDGDWAETVEARVNRLKNEWQRGWYARRQPELHPEEIVADLVGDYGSDSRIYHWLPARSHRTRVVEDLAYALMCVAVEEEIKGRAKWPPER